MNSKEPPLPDHDLINLCLSNDGQAWEKFFRRFTPIIKKEIIRVLVSKGLSRLAYDKMTVEDIYMRVVLSVWWENNLAGLEDHSKCKDWLKKVSEHKTLDWLRSFSRKKNLSKKQGEESALSLYTPINKDESLLLEGTISPTTSHDPETHIELRDTLAEIEKLKPHEMWCLRLKVMFYDPLNGKELAELSRFIQKPVKEVKSEIDFLVENLLVRNKNNDKDENSAGRVHSIILHLQAQLYKNATKGNLEEKEREEIMAEIERRSKRLEFLRNSSSNFIEPSNEEIAGILGIAPEKAQWVSVIIHRARKKLKSKRAMKDTSMSNGNVFENLSS
ncbi:MAG: sigma-70 family RNA polymerase sigma factor [Candidatus Aminicenantes bacterium]|nr:sigma-70 family RNA polymerase sigma factor [Candidatus Aminicenantes bacterium]